MSGCSEFSAPEPVFEQPWHAQVFALTVHLNETGRFEWSEWAKRFSATLKRNGRSAELNGGDDYFDAWLETLELFLAERGFAGAKESADIRQAWETAYRNTPHGLPVRLNG